MKDDYLYSIIIPHKNIPELLKRCLDSIPKRDDIQVIVVDDNSSADIVDFDHFPGKSEANIEVILTTKGGGAGYARNEGLKQAKGKWILFADADDIFLPKWIETTDKYIDSEYNIVYFAYQTLDCDTLSPVNSRNITYLNHVKNNDIPSLRYNFPPPWSKMISHQLIQNNNVKFDEVIAANDVMFSTKIGHFAENNILASNEEIYAVTQRANSLTTTKSKTNIMSRLAVALRYNKLMYHIKSGFRIYPMSYVNDCKQFGKIAYFKALVMYLCKEKLSMIIRDYKEVKRARKD